MNFGKRYAYDVFRTTKAESLGNMLQRCKMAPDIPTNPHAIRMRVEQGTETVEPFEADILAVTKIKSRDVSIVVNTTGNTLDGTFTSNDRTLIVGAELLLPQAEDAHDLYTRGKIRENGIYLKPQDEILRLVKACIDNNGVPEGIRIFPDFVSIGLEYRDYRRWRKLLLPVYLRECIEARTASYLMAYLFFDDFIGMEIPRDRTLVISELAEVAYGKVPLARLGEFATPEHESAERILQELGLKIKQKNQLLLVGQNIIIKAARRALDQICREVDFCDGINPWSMLVLNTYIENALKKLRSLYFVEEERGEKIKMGRNAHITQEKPAGKKIVTPARTITTAISITRASKPPIADFIEACKGQFLGGPQEILTAIHDMARPKELRYAIDHPESIRALLLRYKNELRQKYFDVDAVITEIDEKASRVA